MFISYPKFEKDESEQLNPPVWDVHWEERDNSWRAMETAPLLPNFLLFKDTTSNAMAGTEEDRTGDSHPPETLLNSENGVCLVPVNEETINPGTHGFSQIRKWLQSLALEIGMLVLRWARSGNTPLIAAALGMVCLYRFVKLVDEIGLVRVVCLVMYAFCALFCFCIVLGTADRG